MRRRSLIVALAAAAVALPCKVGAQQKIRIRRIGVMIGAAKDEDGQKRMAVFSQRLKDLGWSENILLDVRWSADKPDLSESFAKELIALNPDVILAHTSINVEMLLRQTRTIPIVFVSVFDPIQSGFVKDLARPSGNVTGFTNHEPSMGGKWLELLKELAPSTDKVTLAFNPRTAPYAPSFFTQSFEPAARVLRIRAKAAVLQDPAEIERMIADLARQKGSGLAVMADPFMTVHRRHVIDLVAKYRIPTVYPWPYFVTDGGLVCYGVDPVDIFRRAATYIDRVLRGEKPGNLPIQAPMTFELFINVKTAKALGIKIPNSILVQATKVIE